MSSSRNRPSPPVENPSGQTLRKGITFFVVTCLIATVGYKLAGWEWLDAFYMVTITIFGVGYGEVHPVEETWLKFFTIGVIFAGCSSLIYVIGGIVQLLAEGEIERMLGTRSRTREIDALSDHTIICGYGRIGSMLAVELANTGDPLVVLDRDEDRVERALEDGHLAVLGSAVDDHSLHKVGLFRAKTLASVLPDDATNVFITLTARQLSNSIRIVARAEDPNTESKLLRSGATSVVIPAAIGAVRIAQLASSGQVEETRLPEQRYRMLGVTTSRADGDHSDNDDTDAEDDVMEAVDELAELASDLTRAVAERQRAELTAEG